MSTYQQITSPLDLQLLRELENARSFDNTLNRMYSPYVDEEERQETRHELLKHYWDDTLFTAPVEPRLKRGGCHVLDFGCGAGTWLTDVSLAYHDAVFVGVDGSAWFKSQPKLPTCTFLQADVLAGVPYSDDYFDFVHVRCFLRKFARQQWEETLLPEILRITKPGGWIQFGDINAEVRSGAAATTWLNRAYAGHLESKDLLASVGEAVSEMLEATGQITDIQQHSKEIRLGPPGGYWGELAMKEVVTSWNNEKLALCRLTDLSSEKFDALTDGCVKESETEQSIMLAYRIVGQKKTGI